jgi:hypothetical protein
VKLTDDAFKVIEDKREDETEKRAIIKRLALNPSAHKKLCSEFPKCIKSDSTASHYLVHEEGYNREAADALVAQFNETAAFAGIYEPDSIPVIVNPGTGEDDQDDEEPDVGGSSVGQPPLAPKRKVQLMESERVAFIEENQPGQYLKLIASGDVDDTMLEALEDYVKRQRKRLVAVASASEELLRRKVGTAPVPPDADD